VLTAPLHTLQAARSAASSDTAALAQGASTADRKCAAALSQLADAVRDKADVANRLATSEAEVTRLKAVLQEERCAAAAAAAAAAAELRERQDDLALAAEESETLQGAAAEAAAELAAAQKECARLQADSEERNVMASNRCAQVP
jgi:hypothetical protein